MTGYSMWEQEESTTSVPYVPEPEIDRSKQVFLNIYTGKGSTYEEQLKDKGVVYFVSVPSLILQHLVLACTAAVTSVYSEVDKLFDGLAVGALVMSGFLYILQMTTNMVLALKNREPLGGVLADDRTAHILMSVVGYLFSLSCGWLVYVNLYARHLSNSVGLVLTVFLIALSTMILLMNFIRLIKRVLGN